MRISFLTNNLPGYHQVWGGAETACYRLAAGLSNLGLDITVVSKSPDRKIEENFKSISVTGNWCKGLLAKASNRFIRFDYYNPILAGEVSKALRKAYPQLVHLQKFDDFSVSVIPQIKKMRLPVVASIYDYILFCPNGLLLKSNGTSCRLFQGLHCRRCFNLIFQSYPGCRQLLQRVFFKHYLQLVDHFIVLSENSAQILRSYGIDDKSISVIPLPLYDSACNLEDLDNGLIVFAGWLSYNKGLHILIRAMQDVVKNVKDAHLEVLGIGGVESYIKEIEKSIRERGLSGKVQLFGRLSQDEVRAILKKANVVVIPEQWENVSPLIMAEAASFARPMVASSIGGIKEFIERDEFLSSSDDPQDFAKKITWVLQNKKEAFALSELLRQKAARTFNPQIAFDKLISLYERLIKK